MGLTNLKKPTSTIGKESLTMLKLFLIGSFPALASVHQILLSRSSEFNLNNLCSIRGTLNVRGYLRKQNDWTLRES